VRIRLALGGLGIALPLLWMARPLPPAVSPGSLQAKQTMLHWRSPDPTAGSPPSAKPTFELVNVGGSPVQIQSVRTNCGCASAWAEPEIVPPGGRSLIRVTLDPLEVGVRAASITLETDAPTTPQVKLNLIAEGYRRPPYLFEINGDLYYHEGYSNNETRKVIVDAVTSKEVPPQPPSLSSDPPLVEFGPASVSERPHALSPDLLVRSYTYPVRFSKEPPKEGFAGEVSVADPWVPGRVLRTRLVAEQNRAIRVVPSLLVLSMTEGDTASPPIHFFVRTNRDGSSLKSVAEGTDNPLIVEAEAKQDDDRFSKFRVTWRPDQKVKEGTYNIIVTSGDGDLGSLTVPVQVRIRKG